MISGLSFKPYCFRTAGNLFLLFRNVSNVPERYKPGAFELNCDCLLTIERIYFSIEAVSMDTTRAIFYRSVNGKAIKMRLFQKIVSR